MELRGRYPLARQAAWAALAASWVLAVACGSEAIADVKPLAEEASHRAAEGAGAATPTATSVPPAPRPSPTAVPSPTATAVPSATPTSTPAPGPLLESVPAGQDLDLIAYSDRLGRVMVAGRDGTDARRIDPDAGFYSWPIWSPSGDRIVFSGIPGQAGESLKLFIYRLGDDSAEVLFANVPRAGPILPNMPHYPLWSPDGNLLALIASTETRLTLFMIDLFGGVPEVIFQMADMYLSWSGDSRRLVVHGGEEHFLIDVGGKKVTPLDERARGYRVPAWWPAGDRYAIISEQADGGRGLFVVEADTGERTMFDTVPGEAAFLWAPDGEKLAVAHSEFLTGLVFQSVVLYLPDGSKMPGEIREDVIAFYWAPDSSKLAYVTFGDSQGVFRWKVLDVATGTRTTLVDFTPSAPQLTQFQFFDQFAYSHTAWSPDSDALVFSGSLEVSGLTDGAELSSQIIVASIGPVSSVRPIAEGLMAFWSPR